MLITRLRWKLRRLAIRLEGQINSWENIFKGTRVKTRMCPSCRALISNAESSCSLCGAKLNYRPSGLAKLLTNFFPRFMPISFTLLTVNFLFFIFTFAFEQNASLEDLGLLIFGGDRTTLINWGADIGAYVAQGEWWRLISGLFIHIGIIHLFFNSYALIFIGPLLEECLGKERFFFTYIATGVCSFIFSNWYYPPFLVTAGASGSVFGLIGLAVVISKRWGTWGNLVQQQLIHWIIYAFFFGIIIGANNAAHLAGALSGALLGLLFPDPNKQGETVYGSFVTKILYWILLLITLVALTMAIKNRFELVWSATSTVLTNNILTLIQTKSGL